MSNKDTIEYVEDGGFRKYRDGKLHCDDGPALFSPFADGALIWFREGHKHKLDGPAAKWDDGTQEWWVEGCLHRIDGPAVVDPKGEHQWWIDGEEYDCLEWMLKVHELNNKCQNQ